MTNLPSDQSDMRKIAMSRSKPLVRQRGAGARMDDDANGPLSSNRRGEDCRSEAPAA